MQLLVLIPLEALEKHIVLISYQNLVKVYSLQKLTRMNQTLIKFLKTILVKQ